MTELSQINPSIAKTVDPWLSRPKVSTAPPGLRNYKPSRAPIQPRPKRDPKAGPPQEDNQRRLAPCGTEMAARRHTRHREPLCDLCKAGREARKQPSKKGTSSAKHGTAAAYTAHNRAKEPICQECRDYRNAYRRELTARKATERAAA